MSSQHTTCTKPDQAAPAVHAHVRSFVRRQGKITAADGAELLRALDQGSGKKSSEPLKGASAPRWFRVRITDTSTGRNKVNVNIPIGLVNVLNKLGLVA